MSWSGFFGAGSFTGQPGNVRTDELLVRSFVVPLGAGPSGMTHKPRIKSTILDISVETESFEKNGYFSGTLMTVRDVWAGQGNSLDRTNNNHPGGDAGSLPGEEDISGKPVIIYGDVLMPGDVVKILGAGTSHDGGCIVEEVSPTPLRGEYRVSLIRTGEIAE